jgi:hypothetical protein
MVGHLPSWVKCYNSNGSSWLEVVTCGPVAKGRGSSRCLEVQSQDHVEMQPLQARGDDL